MSGQFADALVVFGLLIPASFIPLAAIGGGGMLVVPYQHFYIVSAVSIVAALIAAATVAMLAATLLVGGLKVLTNVDCPWDLAGFGGHNPYIALFADRPNALPRAECFPGAHASSGFALMCFYFAFRDRSRRVARWMLAAAIVIGIAFSIGQEARGAHFLSHDLTSAAIVWFVQLALYVKLLRPRADRVTPA